MNRLICFLKHIGAAGGVAHHAGAAADEGDGPVARFLQAAHQHQRHKVAHMQGIGCGVKTNVKCGFSIVDQLFDLFFIGHLGDEPTGLQFFVDRHRSSPLLQIVLDHCTGPVECF